MSVKKQYDVIQDITEQSLLTLDGVAEEITKQTVQEEVDNFIAERTLKENPDEVMAIANKVKEYKKGDKTNFGVVVEVTPSSITFKAKDTPKTKIVFNQRKLGSKDYVLSALSKMNESMEDMRSLDDMEPMEAEDMENMEAEEEETIESLATKLELTDEQVATLAAKSNEKYEEEGDAKLLDMLKMVAMPTDEEHKSAMMELIVNGDFDALEAHIAEMKAQEESDEEEMTESKFKKLTKDKFMKLIKKESVNEEDEDEDEELSQEEEDAWQYSNQLIDAFNKYDEMSIKDFKYYAYKFAHTMDSRTLLNVKSMSDQQLVNLVNDILDGEIGVKLEGDKVVNEVSIMDEKSEMKEAMNRQDREKLISILKSKKFLKLDENNDENQIEDLLVRAGRLLPDDIEVIYEYGHVPVYGAAVIFYPDNDSLIILKRRKYIKSSIQALLKDMSIFDDMDEKSEMKVDTTDIDELVSGEEGLTEGFKEKASIIFEAAVASKVKATKSLLKEQYATRLNEEVEVLKENLVEKIDSYLTYAVETWVNDNKVAVESTLRTEITESFIGSLKNLFTEHYIEVPESKVNIVADMEAQVSSLKEQVDKKGRIANALADRVEKLTRQKVIAEASAGLADTQIAKLTELVEDVEFINEDTFTKKVSTIREFYVNRRAANDKNTLNENVDDNASFISKETIVENQIEGDTISPSMQNYLSAMSRMNKATTANLVS